MMLLKTFHWPGDRFCHMVGRPVEGDSGLLRGFINSIARGVIAVFVILWVMSWIPVS